METSPRSPRSPGTEISPRPLNYEYRLLRRSTDYINRRCNLRDKIFGMDLGLIEIQYYNKYFTYEMLLK